ncbi:WD40 repeat-like protein [Coprinellus micaceus]|uniref:WD40 repeat-like protein n=1 Tax=Coprinellus micaceus TaxID=71717 RepID=A0A4Y7TPY8_COPMI|nr:WD40 repeat-like protein [Coprinellus micaceus]
MAAKESSENFLVSEAQILAEKARKDKSTQFKTLGEPIELSGKALAFEIKGNHAWIGESTAQVKKLELETGKVLQSFKGHTGPVTSIAFCDKAEGSGDQKILISGSWDQSIRIWDTDQLISTTANAHDDFVKTLLVIPSLKLLVSGGSDKIVRFWDLSSALSTTPLQNAGSIASHTRPIECLAGYAASESSAILYTADTMGIIRVWELKKEPSVKPARWRATSKGELNHHRTRINDLVLGQNLVWTASSDETVQIHPAIESEPGTIQKLPQPLEHPALAVKSLLVLPLTDLGESYLLTAAGDFLRVYDISTLAEPELVSNTDVHWHDITAVRLWYRAKKTDEVTHVEPYIVTTSLDQSIRKWRLAGTLFSSPLLPNLLMHIPPPSLKPAPKEEPKPAEEGLTEEEERELAELMGDD